MSNNGNNPLTDMIKELAPYLLSGIFILGKLLPSMREKTPELKADMEGKAMKDISDSFDKLQQMEQRCSEKVDKARNQH